MYTFDAFTDFFSLSLYRKLHYITKKREKKIKSDGKTDLYWVKCHIHQKLWGERILVVL